MNNGERVVDQILRMKRPGGLPDPARAEEDALPELRATRTATAPSSSASGAGRGEKTLVSRAEG